MREDERMDLTEFLRARYAEIEAACRASDAQAMHDRGVQPLVEDEYRYGRVSVQTAWLLDELEAKRRIVEMFTGSLDEKWDDGYEAAKMAAPILGALAQPYADHADFDSAWKVT